MKMKHKLDPFLLGLIRCNADDGQAGGTAPAEEVVDEIVDPTNPIAPDEPSASDAGDSEVWNQLAGDFEAEDNGAEPGTPEEEVAVEPEPEPEPELEPEPEVEPEPEKPTEPEPEKPEPEEDPEPEPEPEPELTAEEQQQRYIALRTQTRDQLVDYYSQAISDDMVEDFQVDPRKVMSQLAADFALDLQDTFQRQLMQQVPQMIVQTQQRTTAAQKGESEFFGRWPQLEAHRDTVVRLGQAYRQMNPQATREQFIAEVGAQAMVAHQIPIAGMGGDIEEEIVEDIPHTPPKAAGTAPVAPAAPKNEWEALAEEFNDDD